MCEAGCGLRSCVVRSGCSDAWLLLQAICCLARQLGVRSMVRAVAVPFASCVQTACAAVLRQQKYVLPAGVCSPDHGCSCWIVA